MTKFREKISDIFEALYGNKTNSDTNELYSVDYAYESEKMEEMLYEYVECMKTIDHIPTISEIMRIIIFAQYTTIGSTECHDFNKLEIIAKDIWDECDFSSKKTAVQALLENVTNRQKMVDEF